MHVAYLDPLTRAWNRMVVILFQPFDIAKWLVIGFAAWLAGLADGGGGGGRALGVDSNDFPSRGDLSHGVGDAWEQLLEHAFLIPLILLAGLVVLALIITLVWLSSRAKFIFLDNVVHNRPAIVEPWKRLRRLGNSLFLWRLGFGITLAIAIGLVLLLFVGTAAGLSGHGGLGGLSIASIAFGAVLISLIALFAAYVSLFLEAFVIPIMYKFDLKATEAWRYFMPWLKSKGGYFLLYGLFVLLLFALFAIVFSVVCLLTCCILLIPYIGTVLLLPVIATYRLLSLEFLAQFDPGFDLFAAESEDVVTG